MAEPAFNAKNYVIDKVRRVTEVDLETGAPNWTATSIEDPQIEFTGETTDKTDAQGVLLTRIDTAKGVNFSGAVSTMNLQLLGSQLGTKMEAATDENKLTGEDFELVKIDPTTHKGTLRHTPKVNPAAVYGIGEDKNTDGQVIEVGVEVETKAQISENTITMPESYKGAYVGVLYTYETEAAVRVVDGSENFSVAAKYIISILASDLCNPNLKRIGTIVFPKAKIDNNVTIGLTPEGNHPFSFSALKDYCSEDEQLCYILYDKQ